MKYIILHMFVVSMLVSSSWAELLRNGDFSAGLRGWELERIHDAEASVRIESEPGMESYVRVSTPVVAAAPFHVQLVQRRLTIEEGRAYRITFNARAEPAARIVANIKIDRKPWPNLWTQPVDLDPGWKTYSYTFRASQTTDIGRLTFSSLGAQAGRFDFADVSIVSE